MGRVLVPFFFIFITAFYSQTPALCAEEDAFTTYSNIMNKFLEEKTRKNDATDYTQAVQNLTGSWSSNSPYISEAKIIDKDSDLRGIVKVPNGSNKDIYHAAGAYYQGSVILSYFSDTGAQLFIGTLNGTTITGDVSLYGPNNVYIGKLYGVVLTKNISNNNITSNANINGRWITSVLSKQAAGEISTSTTAAVGETVLIISGLANIYYGNTPSPYTFRGYLLNSGEVFLWNSNGVDVRTFLGSYASGKFTGLLEQDAVTIDSNTVINRPSALAGILTLMDN